jgi:hypothetical protein
MVGKGKELVTHALSDGMVSLLSSKGRAIRAMTVTL